MNNSDPNSKINYQPIRNPNSIGCGIYIYYLITGEIDYFIINSIWYWRYFLLEDEAVLARLAYPNHIVYLC